MYSITLLYCVKLALKMITLKSKLELYVFMLIFNSYAHIMILAITLKCYTKLNYNTTRIAIYTLPTLERELLFVFGKEYILSKNKIYFIVFFTP